MGLSCQKWTGKKVDPRSTFGRKKWTGGSTFFCQKWTCLAKSGPGPFYQEKSGPGLVLLSKSKQVHFWQGKKVDPIQFPAEIQAGPLLAGEKSGPGPVSLPKSRQVHFWQGKKVDPVQFRCRNPGRSTFGRGKKWTRSSFAAEIQAGPLLAGEKSGPGPVSLPKSRQVHFWQGKKVDPVQFRCRNPGRSTFGRGKKWTRSSFLPKSRQVHFWQGIKVDPVQFPAEIQAGPFLAREKSGPGPVLLLKFRQVH